jgi:hypothetical protein
MGSQEGSHLPIIRLLWRVSFELAACAESLTTKKSLHHTQYYLGTFLCQYVA